MREFENGFGQKQSDATIRTNDLLNCLFLGRERAWNKTKIDTKVGKCSLIQSLFSEASDQSLQEHRFQGHRLAGPSASFKNHRFRFHNSLVPSSFGFGIRACKSTDILKMLSSDAPKWIVAGGALEFGIQSTWVHGA